MLQMRSQARLVAIIILGAGRDFRTRRRISRLLSMHRDERTPLARATALQSFMRYRLGESDLYRSRTFTPRHSWYSTSAGGHLDTIVTASTAACALEEPGFRVAATCAMRCGAILRPAHFDLSMWHDARVARLANPWRKGQPEM